MKLYRVFAALLIGLLLFGLATVASADDPPKKPITNPSESVGDPPPVKGSSDPVPIKSAKSVLDPATASITRLELAEDDRSLVPAAPPPASESSKPGTIRPGKSVGGIFQPLPDDTDVAGDLLLGSPPPKDSDGQEIVAASSTTIMYQNFEGSFPASNWSLIDNAGTGHLWDDVGCNALYGSWAVWPANEGGNGLDPCAPTLDPYPDNMDSWLIYGPFNLADAKFASYDFFFRMVSESDYDFLFWGASIDTNPSDGWDFYGKQVSGAYTSGPFSNGYNFMSFDLTNVYTLGDVTGQSQVWIAFQFYSDASVHYEGPFIDEISLRKNTDPRTFLTFENFDVIEFPNQFWESFDNDGATNGIYRWDDVPCFAQSDGWSMWPADEGTIDLNPCSPSYHNYPNNARSWLIHGPLNLEGASEAYIDFAYRNQSEAGNDWLSWMVSTDGMDFYGYGVSGIGGTSGPLNNGYNLMRFDLSSVYTLGDLRGEPEVWLAYTFNSNASTTYQGPFLDDVRVAVERAIVLENPVFVPIIFRSPVSVSGTTNLYVENQTSGTVSYTVHSTPQGNITCSGIAAGSTVLCGTFTSGTYQVSVTTTQCGSNSGEVYFVPGDVTRIVRCVS